MKIEDILAKVAKGETLMKVIPAKSFLVQFDVPEGDLFSLQEGQKVSMELYWETETGKSYSGEILSISYQNSEQKSETDRKTYRAYASIDADERIRVGMTVLLSIPEAQDP